MKLLVDHNISHRAMSAIRQRFPGSVHVADLGYQRAHDALIWEHAQEHGFATLSKDDDFRQRSMLHGTPPKVIWVRVGNVSTDEIAAFVLDHADEIEIFLKDPDAALLMLP